MAPVVSPVQTAGPGALHRLEARVSAPAVILPPEARKRLAEEAASIRRCYKIQVLRDQALDLVLQRLREDYPQAFKAETDGDPSA